MAIDRQALVTRHNVTLDLVDPLSPLSVGNGRFCFTADVTGLQTLRTEYNEGIPLATMAEWGWNSHPNTGDARPEDTVETIDTYGREVPYLVNQRAESADWLRANPHQTNLGAIGFVDGDGETLSADGITSPRQHLDLWRGHLSSRFEFSGELVEVETVCHPESDTIGIRATSTRIGSGDLAIALVFPYTSAVWGKDPADWDGPDRHTTSVDVGVDLTVIDRRLDDLAYSCSVHHGPNVGIELAAPHTVVVRSIDVDRIELVIAFSPGAFEGTPTFGDVKRSTEHYWAAFWQSGGAIDLSGSDDPRWRELERRVVLSQYVTAIQSTGSLPPAETGLTCNSWFGKFHLEMHWWHHVHFALWGRLEQMLPSLDYYDRILERARETARWQGYRGARWPKMVGPSGEESPSAVGPYLIWQQPHPIYYAELVYRQKQDDETLARYRDVVFESADFMASYAHRDEVTGRYDLGPPLIPAQENHPARVTRNSTYELVYWRWGLEVAQQWRERMGLAREELWDDVIAGLAPLPCADGLYTATENRLDTWKDEDLWRDHPSFLCALGVLPGDGVDPEMMRATLKKTRNVWNWDGAWGWDFPVAAMCAARLGEGSLAIDLLLLDAQKNTYLPNGHNFQAARLPLYLPGNGGLLTAVAMMAAGWDGGTGGRAFPEGWDVRHEGLWAMP